MTSQPTPSRKFLVLGASGLIGSFLTEELRTRGFAVIGAARRFSPSQKADPCNLEMPLLTIDQGALARLLVDHGIDIVVNCVGVLQDGPGSDTKAVHCDFVAKLLQAICGIGRNIRLIHLSIPGLAEADRTAFSQTKREAERLIAASGHAHAILRPGFVVAPAAYGGSAMLRALAAVSIDLPAAEAEAPLQPVAALDIATTIVWLAGRDVSEPGVHAVAWDLMQPQPMTLGAVIEQFRRSFGSADLPRLTLPAWMIDLAASLGDLANLLGWMPPLRTTAIAELRRGVNGDPSAWMAATGIVPQTIKQIVGLRAASIQDKWFARLFLVKPLVIASLVLFWTVSGFIALVISYRAAAAILVEHHFAPALVAPVTIGTSLMDMTIGALIAFRRSCRTGLVAGIAASLCYMVGAVVLAWDLWIEPLGALVKTGPAVMLMGVALLTLDNR